MESCLESPFLRPARAVVSVFPVSSFSLDRQTLFPVLPPFFFFVFIASLSLLPLLVARSWAIPPGNAVCLLVATRSVAQSVDVAQMILQETSGCDTSEDSEHRKGLSVLDHSVRMHMHHAHSSSFLVVHKLAVYMLCIRGE